MPNYCSCDLYISGETSDPTMSVRPLLEYAQGPEGALDFMKIIPCDRGVESQTRAWGTKWQPLHFDVHGSGEGYVKICFQSAWSPAYPIIRALAAKFPHLEFSLEWFERGMQVCGGLHWDPEDKSWEEWFGPYKGVRGG